MFSSSIVAASGVSTGYSETLTVGVTSVTDKGSTVYTYCYTISASDGTTVLRGALSNDIVTLGGSDHRIMEITRSSVGFITITIRHPDYTNLSGSSLGTSLFTSISTDLGTLTLANAASNYAATHGTSPNQYRVTTYLFTSGDDIVGTTATNLTLTITE